MKTPPEVIINLQKTLDKLVEKACLYGDAALLSMRLDTNQETVDELADTVADLNSAIRKLNAAKQRISDLYVEEKQ